MVHIRLCDQKNHTLVVNIELGRKHDTLSKYYNELKWESRFTLGLNERII